MSLITVGKWGKNLAIRFPREIARAAGLSNGEKVEVETQDGEIIVRRTTHHFTLRELFAGQNAKQWRAAYRGAFDWGLEIGRERVDE